MQTTLRDLVEHKVAEGPALEATRWVARRMAWERRLSQFEQGASDGGVGAGTPT